MNSLFPAGQVVSTPGALGSFDDEQQAHYALDLKKPSVSPVSLLRRHLSGDWGEVGEEDANLNNEAVKEGTRILSSYVLPHTKVKVWIITEADRSATTFLLPSEY